MTPTAPPADCVTLGRRSLHQLRTALERTVGVHAATLLQEAGFASGEALYQALEQWIAERYRTERPQDLDASVLGEALSGFFSELGWGALTLEHLSDAVLQLDALEWAESSPGAGQYPSCHLSAGVLADVFSRLAGGQYAAMEVECRSRGDARCRFLLASPETLTLIYERMTHGLGYRQSLGLG
ncbi:MAG TPA: V4R domain-containing protein [Gemmatimonadales bacterium]